MIGFFRKIKPIIKPALFLSITEIIRILVPKGKNTSLLVLKIDALGDFFIWLSSGISEVSDYCRKYKGGAVIVVREELQKLVADLGIFETIFPINVRKFRTDISYRIRFLIKMRRHGFSEVLQMRIARDFLIEDLITRTVGASVARAPLGDRHNLSAWEAKISDAWYHPILRFDDTITHELTRNQATATALFGTIPRRLSTHPDTPPPSLGITHEYFIVAPGAGWASRRWPIKHFIEVSKRLTQSSNLQCAVIGGPDDAKLGEEIRAAVGGDALNLCGALTQMDLAAIVARSTIVIGNESGPVHMAAYFGVASVAILGGGHYGWFMPYPDSLHGIKPPRLAFVEMPCFGCNWHCRYQVAKDAPVPCIEDVTVDRAWQEVLAVMAEQAAAGSPPPPGQEP